jgi:hypothetical protein
MPKKKEEEVLQIPAIEFSDKEGVIVTLDKVLEQGDYWNHKSRKSDAWIISHRGVLKLAKIAGIKPPINTPFTLETEKSYKNSMNVEIVAHMTCEAKSQIADKEVEDNGKCIHGSDRKFICTGEASNSNTFAVSSKYIRTMSEKRAYDRGLLQHLELNEKVNVYSEDESPEFEEKPPMATDAIIEKYASLLNEIVNSPSKEDLMRIAQNVREMKIEDAEELIYLRKIWIINNNRFVESF